MGEQIPYTKPYERPSDLDPKVNGPFRDVEEEEVQTLRRQGKIMELIELDAEKALAAVFPDENAEPVATEKKAAKKSAKSK